MAVTSISLTKEQREIKQRQAREIAALEQAIQERGISRAAVARKAGYHENLIYTWQHAFYKMGLQHRRLYSPEAYRKIWAALDKLTPVPSKSQMARREIQQAMPPAAVVEALTQPVEVSVPKGNGVHRNEGQEALLNLISERVAQMSTVQLALLYAHIVGEEG